MTDRLNASELCVLRDSVAGISTQEIARKMHICGSYVSLYRQRIRDKLGAENFYHAIAIALREGIIQ